MNTTFVLHGGKTSQSSIENDKFYSLFTALVNKKEVNILMSFWARSRDRWNNLLERHESKIIKNSTKKVNINIAEDPKDFYNKIDLNDVFYVDGGAAEYLESL